MKLYLEINDQTYYLGQSHKRQALKTYDTARAVIIGLLAKYQIKYKTYQVQSAQTNNAKASLFACSKLCIKLSMNSNNYLIKSKDTSDTPIVDNINILVKQAIKNVHK